MRLYRGYHRSQMRTKRSSNFHEHWLNPWQHWRKQPRQLASMLLTLMWTNLKLLAILSLLRGSLTILRWGWRPNQTKTFWLFPLFRKVGTLAQGLQFAHLHVAINLTDMRRIHGEAKITSNWTLATVEFHISSEVANRIQRFYHKIEWFFKPSEQNLDMVKPD